MRGDVGHGAGAAGGRGAFAQPGLGFSIDARLQGVPRGGPGSHRAAVALGGGSGRRGEERRKRVQHVHNYDVGFRYVLLWPPFPQSTRLWSGTPSTRPHACTERTVLVNGDVSAVSVAENQG